MKLSIIIPVYNEEITVATVIKRLKKLNISSVTKEIIVVDDGSSDHSVAKIKNQKSKIKNIKLIIHKRNMGKGAAVITGIKNTTADYIIIQDADLEYHPKYIERLLQPILEKKAEVVYGTRLRRLPNLLRDEKNPLFLLHYLGNRFLSLVTSLLYGQWITDMETGYKLFPKKAIKDMKLNARGFEFEPEITSKLLKRGYKIFEVPISTKPRGYKEGKKIRTFRDGTKAFWCLIKYRFMD